MNFLSNQNFTHVMPNAIEIPKDQARAVLKAKIIPRYMVGLFEAVGFFACTGVIVNQSITPFKVLKKYPTIWLIGDDLFHSYGPAGFHKESLATALSDVSLASIVTTEVMPDAYNAAVTVASRDRKNSAIIETRPEQLEAWLKFIRNINSDCNFLCTICEEDADER